MEENEENQSVAIDEETKQELEKRKKNVFKFFLYSVLVITVFAAGFIIYNMYPKFDFNVKDKFFESNMVDTTLNEEIVNIESNDNQQTNTEDIKKSNNNEVDSKINDKENNNDKVKDIALYHVIAFSSNNKQNVQRYMKKFKSKDFKCTLLENNNNIRLSIRSFDNYQDAKKFVKKCKIKYKTLCKDVWVLNPTA